MGGYRYFKSKDLTEEVGEKILSDNLLTKMNNGIGKLDLENIKSALVYGLLMGFGAVLLYILKVGSVFSIDWKVLVDAFVIGAITSIIKNFFTTNDGKFLGMVKTVSK